MKQIRFNGAAAQRLRKRCHRDIRLLHLAMLQWSRSSKAAETLLCRIMPCIRLSFNGAAAQRLRKRRGAGDSPALAGRASMEPQLRGCGNGTSHNHNSVRVIGFNGAAAQRLRKRDWMMLRISSMLALQWSRSSEAAETPSPAARLDNKGELQWSRSSEAAETCDKVRVLAGLLLASMEPQLRGCGNS